MSKMFSCIEGRKKVNKTRNVTDMKYTLKQKLSFFVLFIYSTILTISVAFGATGVVLPSKIGIERIDLEKTLRIDNKNYPFTFIDGMMLEDGRRLITIDNKTYTIQVKTLPDDVRLNGVTEAYTYVFESTATFYDPTSRTFNAISKSKEMRISEKVYIAVAKDEFGNVSDIAFVPPTLERLDILDSQTPINNISGRKFLLSSRSPYRIIGKTVLPENNVLLLENGVTIVNALNPDMNIKGAVVTTGPVTFLGSGSLSVSDLGLLYLNALATDTNINADRGSLVFLDNSYLKDANLSMPNFVVIRKSTLKSVKINSAFAVYLIDSTIDKLEIQNCGYVVVNNSTITSESLSSMTKATVYNSQIGSLNLSDLSYLAVVSSKIGTAYVTRGSILKSKNSSIETTEMDSYSISYLFKSTLQQLKINNSKYYTLESTIKKIQK